MALARTIEHERPLIHRDLVAELGGLGTVAYYDALAERYVGGGPEAEAVVAYALYAKAITLRAVGLGDQAVNTYDEVIERFRDQTDSKVLAYVAEAG